MENGKAGSKNYFLFGGIAHSKVVKSFLFNILKPA